LIISTLGVGCPPSPVTLEENYPGIVIRGKPVENHAEERRIITDILILHSSAASLVLGQGTTHKALIIHQAPEIIGWFVGCYAIIPVYPVPHKKINEKKQGYCCNGD
jgi:hypothetical protein